MTLQIPYYSQEDSDARLLRNDCGETVAAGIIQYFTRKTITPDTLSKQMPTYPSDLGSTPLQICNLLRANGVDAELKTRQHVNDIYAQAGIIPMIPCIWYGAIQGRDNKADINGLHFVTITGLYIAPPTDSNKSYIAFNDPDYSVKNATKGINFQCPIGQFELAFTRGVSDHSVIYCKGVLESKLNQGRVTGVKGANLRADAGTKSRILQELPVSTLFWYKEGQSRKYINYHYWIEVFNSDGTRTIGFIAQDLTNVI